MGTGNCKAGLQTRVQNNSSFQWNNTFSSTQKSHVFGKGRIRRSFRKKYNRNSSTKPNSERFLQYVIFSTKKERGNETSHKFKTSKSVSSETSFQNGHNAKGFKPCEVRRLGNNSRSKRRLLPCTNMSNTQEVSKIQCSRKKLPIQSSMFWTNIGSKSFYKNSLSCSSSFKKTQHSLSYLPGRLASCEQKSNRPSERSRVNAQSPDKAGFYSQCPKVSTDTLSGHNIYRGSFQTRQRSCVSNSRENCKVVSDHSQSLEGQCVSSELFDGARSDCLSTRVNSERQIVHETNTITPSSELAPFENEFESRNCLYSRVEIPFYMVVRATKHFAGSISYPIHKSSHSDHGCIHNGMGGSLGKSKSTGDLVSPLEIGTHKLSGVGSSISHSETFSPKSEKQKCSDSFGQYDNSPIHKQTRGYSVSQIVSTSMETVAISHSEQHCSSSSSHSRVEKRASRQFEPGQGQGDRVVFESQNNTSSVQSPGSTCDRSVCFLRKQENTSVLLMGTPSTSVSIGCPLNNLGEHVCLCLPPNMLDSEGITTHETVSLRANTDSTTLATPTLVSATSGATDSLSSKTSSRKQSVKSSKGKNSSSKSTVSKTDCMVTIDRQFKTKGFSKNTRKLLSASWRTGTQKDYKCKFRQFSSWCEKQKIDPYAATLAECANFLTYLFDKGLKYRTIAGYRSMLSTVLAPVEKFPVGQHPYIIRLLRGIFNTRPPVKRLLPEWDLLIVLDGLKNAPFEPMKDAPLKFVTWKTVFLVAITTFRRCSDIKSLRLGEGAVNVQSQGITFIRQGLSKQDRANHEPTKIVVPCFSENKLLDPKRAIAYYLKKTEKVRRSESQDKVQLFLSTVKPHNPVTSQTISNWIVKLIKFTYKKAGKTVQNVRGHSTRSVGPSWALFKGAAMKNVLESADWSKETTFTKFYLKSVNVDFLKTSE